MSSGFISEKDLAEARQKRQEEWEKVRTQEQPLECPEEPYDGRSLYERLKEQKMKKTSEIEEAHKLKNLIRGLDGDEVDFLELVDKNKIEVEKKQMQEEEKELKEFRTKAAKLKEESVEKKIQAELKQCKQKPTNANSRPSQKALLGVGIKRKCVEPTSDKETMDKHENKELSETGIENEGKKPRPELISIQTDRVLDRGALKCVAILPGIGPNYLESSDSEVSSGSDDEIETLGKYDLVGRKIKKKKACESE